NDEVHINTLVPGRINVLMANWGDNVSKGQPLVCIESLELGKKRAEYEKAYAELELASKNYERKRKLFEQEAVSQKQLLEAETQKISAEINLEYAKKMLRMTGLKEEEIIAPPDEHDVIEGCSVHLVSPINGVVIERNVKRGEQVEPGNCLFKILDVSSVWIEADVFEKDLHCLRQGRPIKVVVPSYSDRVFTGRIFWIGSTLNEETRTVKVRSKVANKDGKLKPGMFATVEIVTGIKKNVITVPEAAVLSEDIMHFVFVKEGDRYHRHAVTVGISSGSFVEITSGVSAGDLVVIQGNYQLKSRLMMSGIDPHAGHTH
ncbi:efflux RND transporter periplasmic adaptor subunit, partial [candidate division KSB1 bacterium]